MRPALATGAKTIRTLPIVVIGYGLTGKQNKKKAASIRTEISSGWWSIEEVNIRARAEALVHNGKSAVIGRGPEIGFQNVDDILRFSYHRVDRRRRRDLHSFKWRPFVTEIEQRRLDLEERRLEVDRLRENIAQNRQLQEKFLQRELVDLRRLSSSACYSQLIRIRSSYDSQFQMLRRHEGRTSWNGADRAVQWRNIFGLLSL
ncbi:hypothetical protein EVAR_60307_1 [Eumeta japonica]|uniref:Uncharacterized protein n=1 Tax=Eumeta variegata TaxID=151549 RepID=A0A4C1ZLF7_EUMVA|nr:hypothetical protein EVAR_60307_1 [Eumeta japonica]